MPCAESKVGHLVSFFTAEVRLAPPLGPTAVGYNVVALPIAAGVFAPLGIVLRPEVAALSMSGSSLIVAVNALMLKRLRLPAPPPTPPRSDAVGPRPEPAPAGHRV